MDREIPKKSFLIRNIKYIIPAGIFFIFLFWYLLFVDKESTYKIDFGRLSVATVQFAEFQDYISVRGTVEPFQTIFLDATEGGSRVEEIIVEEGAFVEKGQLLFKLSNIQLLLDISNYEALVSRTLNELRQARLQMESQTLESKTRLLEANFEAIQRKRTYSANKKLFEEGLISKEEYLLSEEMNTISQKQLELYRENLSKDSVFRSIQVDQLERSANMMQNDLLIVRKRMEVLNFRAPVTGELASLDLEVGQVIQTGQRLGQINILNDYKLNVPIDQYYNDKVFNSLKGKIDFGGKYFDVQIVKILPEVNNGRFTVEMEFVGQKPENIRIGQSSMVRLELAAPDTALVIPKGGFYQSTSGNAIFVLDEKSQTAHLRNIKIGRQNPNYYEILEGLQAGEKVIISSYDSYKNIEKLILK